MARTVNAIKDKLIETLTVAKDGLGATGGVGGVKTIKADIAIQDMVEACKTELAYFPAIIVNYAGRYPSREGQSLKCEMAFALFVAQRDLSGPFVSGRKIIDLLDDLVELLDGKRPANEQKTAYEFTGEELVYQDPSLVIYQMEFRTSSVHARRF